MNKEHENISNIPEKVMINKWDMLVVRGDYARLMDLWDENKVEKLSHFPDKIQNSLNEYLEKVYELYKDPISKISIIGFCRSKAEEIIEKRESKSGDTLSNLERTYVYAGVPLGVFKNNVSVPKNEELEKLSDKLLSEMEEAKKVQLEVKSEIGDEAKKRLNTFVDSLRKMVGEDIWHERIPEFYCRYVYPGAFEVEISKDESTKRIFYKPYEGKLVTANLKSSITLFEEVPKDMSHLEILGWLHEHRSPERRVDKNGPIVEAEPVDWVDLHRKIARHLVYELKIHHLHKMIKDPDFTYEKEYSFFDDEI